MRAKADARREASPKPKYPRRWKPLVAVAAMLLVLAAVIVWPSVSLFLPRLIVPEMLK